MPDLQINGVRIHYTDTGRGDETLLFSHGLLWSNEMFRPQIDALKANYRCIAWDHRGQGRSEVPRDAVIEIEDCYRDAVALIEALELGPVHFVGLSMGGFVGIRLGARNPELVKSLLLLDTAADPEPAANIGKYRRLCWIVWLMGIRSFLANIVMPIMFSKSFLEDPEKTAIKAEWRERLRGNERTIIKSVYGVINRAAVTGELANITAPTLVLRGDEDTAIAEPRARALAEGIAGATYVGVPAAGHTSTIEQPELVTAAIKAFLATPALDASRH